MKKITKRDLLFFVLGLLAMLVFETIYNWNDSVNAFKKGYDSVPEVSTTQ